MHNDKGLCESFKTIKVSLAHDTHSTWDINTPPDIYYTCFCSVLSGCRAPRKQTAGHSRWHRPRESSEGKVRRKNKRQNRVSVKATLYQKKPEWLPAEEGTVLSFTHPDCVFPHLHPSLPFPFWLINDFSERHRDSKDKSHCGIHSWSPYQRYW